MKSEVLITRPQPDADTTAAEVQELGWTPFIEPMLDIVSKPVSVSNLKRYAALVFTSTNGVRAFTAHSPAVTDRPVYAVGERTAQAARVAGFPDVRGGSPDSAALNRLLAVEKPPGPVLHLSGVNVGGAIEAPGGVERLVIYKAKAAEALTPQCRALLAAGAFNAALFFSARTAHIFVKLAEKAGCTRDVSSIKALCISDSVVESLRTLPWRDVQAAPTPDKAALLALLGRPGTF